MLKVLVDPDFIYERYFVPNAGIGGEETFECRRFLDHFVSYREIIDGELVQMGGVPVHVP